MDGEFVNDKKLNIEEFIKMLNELASDKKALETYAEMYAKSLEVKVASSYLIPF